MKIVEISTRRIRLGAEPWFAPHAIPDGYVPYWEFPFTTLHTDEGIDGYTMDYGPLGQGRGPLMRCMTSSTTTSWGMIHCTMKPYGKSCA